MKNEMSDYTSRNNFDVLNGESSEALAKEAFQRMDVQLDLCMRIGRLLEGWSLTDYQSEYKDILQTLNPIDDLCPISNDPSSPNNCRTQKPDEYIPLHMFISVGDNKVDTNPEHMFILHYSRQEFDHLSVSSGPILVMCNWNIRYAAGGCVTRHRRPAATLGNFRVVTRPSGPAE